MEQNNPYITDIKVDNYGFATDMLALPVGTKFNVVNGQWKGSVALDDEQRKVMFPDGADKGFLINDRNRYGYVLDQLQFPKEKADIVKAVDKIRVSKGRLYSEPDESGSRHKIATIYNIALSPDEADFIGAYHSDSVPGELVYEEYTDGRRELGIGVAASGSNICSYSFLNESKGEFTRSQVNMACHIVQDSICAFTDSDFKLSESVISDTVFADDGLQERADSLVRSEEEFFEDEAMQVHDRTLAAESILQNLSEENEDDLLSR